MPSQVPATKAQLEAFRKELKQLTRYQIADKRYTGDWGHFDPKDSTKSSWMVREANRYLEELNRSRELQPLTFGVWVGVLTAAVAILAMPSRDSMLAATIGEQSAQWVMRGLVVTLVLAAVAFLLVETTRPRD
jgi:hypothetical protein